MALLNRPVQVYAQLPKFLETIRAGTAPATFNRQFLKDIDFKSSNHLEFIPLLKGLGFLTQDGTPTERYRNFLDGSRWKKVLAEAIREAYGDIFVIKAKPTDSDRQMIAGKFKSTFNQSDITADRCARTFLTLLNLSDQDSLYATTTTEPQGKQELPPPPAIEDVRSAPKNSTRNPLGLHYNIQIHLPATKDIEIYNAIFRSMRENLID